MPSITSNTPSGIIKDAMFNAGLLATGEDPTSEDYAVNFRRLNDLINLWQTQGLKLFLNSEISFALIAGVNTYNFADPLVVPQSIYKRVLQGRVVESVGGTSRPIYPISWDEWNRLAQPQEGTIVQYLVDKQTDQLVVKFWNTPSVQEATNTPILLVQRQVINAINLEESMEFPQEWRIALCWGLADEISTGQPQAIMDRCEKKAKIFRDALEDWDVEDAPTSFAPDYRFQNSAYSSAGKFR
jgi:hypothetical protein